MNVRAGLAALSIGVLVTSLAACSSSSGGSDKELKFAAMGPLTGDSASYGTNLKHGIDLAVKSINKSGGIDGKKVSVKFYDDKCDPSEGATVASRIVSDRSFFAVMGPVCSAAALAEGPVLERAKLAMLAGDTTSPKLTGRFDNFARTIPSDSQEAIKLVELATQTMHKTKLGVLYASDDFGQPIYQGIKAAAAKHGASIVDAETFTPSQTKDFTPALTKLASHHPQLVLLVGYYNDIGVAVSQFSDAGLKGIPNLSTAGVDNPGFIKLAGKAAEGSIVFSYYNPENETPANKKFVTEFQKAYTDLPNEQAAYGYELLFIYKKAIEAGAKKSDLIDKVKQVTYNGPTGTTKFKANGDVDGKVGVVLKVTGGKFAVDQDLTRAANATN